MDEIKNGPIINSFPNSRHAWEIVFILGFSTILLAIIAFLLKSYLIRNSVGSLIYSLIPSIITIAYVLLRKEELLGILLYKWEINHWHRYISFLLIVSGIVLISYSLLSIIKITSIVLRMEIIMNMSRFVSLIMFFALVIIAPLFEEFIFRGVVLNGFLTHYSPLKAILLSSLLFSILHFNPFQFIGTFFLGLITGWYYSKTRNLLSCIIIHSMYNLVGFLFMFNFFKKSSAIKYNVDESLFLNHNLLIFFLIAIAIVTMGFLGLHSSFRHNRGD